MTVGLSSIAYLYLFTNFIMGKVMGGSMEGILRSRIEGALCGRARRKIDDAALRSGSSAMSSFKHDPNRAKSKQG
jgi:hypothetical protein